MRALGFSLTRRIQRVLQVILARLADSATCSSDTRPANQGVLLRLSNNFESPNLAGLFTMYGSDKGWEGSSPPPFPWAPHNYAAFYEFLFMGVRNRVKTVVECGIGTNNTDVASNMTSFGRPGASLRAWRDFFPHANIIGLDIDERILFTEERINSFWVDQTDSESVRHCWELLGLSDVDIIIDDGLHTFEAGVSFFESSIQRLHKNGIFIIEDVSADNLKLCRAYFNLRPETVHYVQIFRRSAPVGDNTLIVIQPT